ncbi:hypothetical protein TVAG_014130 [Trichomonas vaginalis G3]|uniref:Uncharacterized protein n=1 Tax=Trichomonas vaginalis (strain ATCC PRA-98 / G3) TaxID=412133 RepID=A2DDG7_TRIV3|nr:glucose import [Trichomonas vaginalis G3]EAY21646.1 hypothetical protein TVAG_014130 [Trichomonas vaginalis G3]KAI5489678.1 glucose import [Trichomonas vaginalis G3]|eukprot:XP_001582632.1 hypothetical protein [Trichomonas vaginalis G3]
MSSFFRRELLYAAIVCLTPLGFGYLIGYPSPAAQKFRLAWGSDFPEKKLESLCRN